jgi:hypothetical protein
MATTTPNYGWPVPTSTDLVKDGATAIEALGDAIDATAASTFGGGFKLVKTQAFTGVSSQTVTSIFSSTYTNYKILIRFTTNTADTNLTLKLRNGATDTSANYYYGGYYSRVDAGGNGVITGNNTSSFSLGSMDIGNPIGVNNVEMNIFNPNTTANKSVSLIGLSQDTGGPMNGIYYGGALLDAQTFDSVNIISSSGNISGTAWVYGFAK